MSYALFLCTVEHLQELNIFHLEMRMSGKFSFE